MVTYIDHAATTPMRPECTEAMLPFLGARVGNPSGGHALARAARQAIEEARDVVAACLGAEPGEVVFTGGGTEADNLAVTGVLARLGGIPVCSAVEHHAVLRPVEALDGRIVAVHTDGRIDLAALDAALDGQIGVVSLMLVNNEVGVVQPLAEAAALVAERSPGAVVHTDAVQAFPWLDVATEARPAHLVAVSAHKFGGPQGVGALVVREGVAVEPLLRGGGQERDRRSGTHNVAGIVGMAAAMVATVAQRPATVERVAGLRDRLADGLLTAVPGVTESGNRATKVAGTCSLLIEGIESEALLVLLDQAGICATAASSCASGALDPSHVLAAMGVPRALAYGSLRLSLGWTSTEADVDRALEVVPGAVAQLRERTAVPVLR
ncbi:MAG: aminotransferase class V-fold PLP-dependent enzyme [Actinomycetota bacterium]|nr:aminotransferase class V-fold PLP-dependent enzyme [Actinomycetota bacterium]